MRLTTLFHPPRRLFFLTFLLSTLVLLLALPAATAGNRPPDGGRALLEARSLSSTPLGCHDKSKAEIKKPSNHEIVSGTVEIRGKASGRDFSYYTLSFASAADPENWTTICTRSEPVNNGKLADWDTTTNPDGTYLLKLTVFLTSGQTAEDQLEVRLDNNPPSVTFTSPTEGSVVQQVFDVIGTVTDANLERWKLTCESVSPMLLSHFNGNTVNERTGDEGDEYGNPSYQQGKFSQGIHMGEGQGLTYQAKKNIEKDAGTIELWVIPDWPGDEAGTHVLLQTKTSDPAHPTNCLRLAKDERNLTFTVYDGTGRSRSCSIPVTTDTLPAGVPFHLAATWESGNLTLALNGSPSGPAQGDGSGAMTDLSKKVYVGFYPNTSCEADATLDELSIYSYPRTISQVRTDYLSGAPKNMGSGKQQVAQGQDPIDNSILRTVNVSDSPGERLSLTLEARDEARRETEVTESLYIDNPNPTALITTPAEESEVEGEVILKGTAFDMDLSSYTLSFKPGSDPNGPGDWTQFASSTQAVWYNALGVWTASGLPSGPYILRLEVADASGKVADSFLRLTVKVTGPPLVEISSPSEGQAVLSPIPVAGTVRNPNLDHWELTFRELSPSFLSHFDGNTRNERDGSEGQLSGSPSFTAGKFSQGLFLGQNDQLSYPASGNISKDEGTLELWVNPTWSGMEATSHALFATSPPTQEMKNMMMLGKGRGSISFIVVGETGGYKMASFPVDDTSMPAGVPFHLAATWKNGDLELFLNGVKAPAATGTGSGIVSEMGQAFYAGSFFQPGMGASATIDELSIYAEARDQSTILEDFHASAPRTYAADWNTVSTGTNQVESGTLGSINTAALPGEKAEVRLSMTDRGGESQESIRSIIVDSPTPRGDITSPLNGQLLFETVEVKGTAADIDFSSYELSYKPGTDPGSPEPWHPIGNPVTNPVYSSSLSSWDTRGLPNGEYCLRLKVTDMNGRESATDRVVALNNDVPTAEITFPLSDGGAPESCEIRGSACGLNFSGYKLEYKSGHDPDSPYPWLLVGSEQTEPVENGTLETWDTMSLSEGPFLLRLTVHGIPGMDIVRTAAVYVDHTLPVALITSPDGSGSLTGLVKVEGKATDERFAEYKLEYASNDNPSVWLPIADPSKEPVEGLLGWWNTEIIPDGAYILRLTCTDTAGHEAACSVAAQVTNPPSYTITGIRTEPTEACLAVGETVDFIVVATDALGYDHLVRPAWEVTGGIGTVDQDGHFQATSLGEGTVRITYLAFTFEAPVSVVHKVGPVVLTEDTTWTADVAPWVVEGWVVVPSGVTLTVEPGAVSKFERSGVYVEGTLNARGAVLTSASTEGGAHASGLYASADSSSLVAQAGEESYAYWSGIYLAQGSTALNLDSAEISYAGLATDEDIIGGRRVESSAAITASGVDVHISSCSIAHSPTDGIDLTNSNPVLRGNTITDVARYGVLASGGQAGVFSGNQVTAGHTGIWTFRVKESTYEGNTLTSCMRGLAVWDDTTSPQGLILNSNTFNACGTGLEINASQAPGGIEISSNRFNSCSWMGESTVVLEPTIARTTIHDNTFDAPAQDGYIALSVSGTSDTTVTGNIISGYGTGIQGGSCEVGDLTVSGNVITYTGAPPSFGIILTTNSELGAITGRKATCTGNQVQGCFIGILASYTGNNYFSETVISDNTVTGPGPSDSQSTGIWARFDVSQGGPQASSVKFERNDVTGFATLIKAKGFRDTTVTNETLFTCDILDGVPVGVFIEFSENLTFTDNVLSGNGVMLKAGCRSVDLARSHFFLSEGRSPSFAATLTASENSTVDSNEVAGYWSVDPEHTGLCAGISVQGGGTAVFSSNEASGLFAALGTDGPNATFAGNTVTGCFGGIGAQGAEITIEDNDLTSISGTGIGARGGLIAVNGNDVYGTNASPRTGDGMELADFSGGAHSNYITGFHCGVNASNPQGYPKITGNTVSGNGVIEFSGEMYEWPYWSAGLICSGPDYVDASGNWWGDASGPFPFGKGNSVSGYADVQPWGGQTVWFPRRNGHDQYPSNDPNCGEPVNMTTGNFYQAHTDLNFEGTGPNIEITRTYNSLTCDTRGPFGCGWEFTYSERIEPYLTSFVTEDKLFITSEGAYLHYINNGDGTFSPEDDDHSVLRKNEPSGTWTLTQKDGSYKSFDSYGCLSSITDANGNTLSIARDENLDVTSVTDACGQTATFTYEIYGTIASVTDPAGRVISYRNDGWGNLDMVTDLNSGQTRYQYDEDHRMTAVIDPNLSTFVRNTYDSKNRVIVQQDAHGNVVHFDYDERAHKNEFTDALGQKTTYSDDLRLYHIGETDALDSSISILRDEDGNETSRTDKLGLTTNYSYDERGNMLSETDSLGNTTSHTYDGRGNRLSTTDPLGNTTNRVFDAKNNLISETDPLGNTSSYTYDSAGRQLTSTDPMGNTSQNSYDERGNLVQVIHPDGGIEKNAYDAANRKTSTTDAEGNTTTFTYDTMGHVLTSTDPQMNVTTYSYDYDGNQVSVTDPLGNRKQTTYEKMGKVSSEIDELGNIKTYEYDENGRREKEFDELGNATTHVYDVLGREVETIDRKGNSTHKNYDAAGRITEEFDAEGTRTSYTYDDCGRRLTTTDALGNTTSSAYDKAGREISTTDALGHVTTKSYDEAGRLASTEDAEHNVTTYSYDENGNKTAETDPLGHTTHYAYDSMNRLASTTDPEGRTVSQIYDLNGNKISTTDGTGATTTFEYDGLNRLVRVTDPAGSSVSYSYDEAGKRTSMTDPSGGLTQYAYDACGRILTETNELGETVSYTYDAAGRTLTKTDGEGTTTFSFDENGNKTSAEYPGGLVETATYDKCNRPLERSGGGFAITCSYDELGRPESVTNAFSTTTSATYDAVGNVTGKTLTTPGAEKAFTYSYDSLNRMTGATDENGTTTFTYDPSGRIITKTCPNGVSTEFSYDASGMASGLEIEKDSLPLKTYRVERDSRANVTSVTEDGTMTTTYSYDPASKLTGENNPWMGDTTYTYDSSGNRLTKETQGQPALTYSYNEADQLLSDSVGNTYSYNHRGDLVRKENGTYVEDFAWDGKGRLQQVTDTDGIMTYFGYDPLDRAFGSMEGGEITLYAYDMTSDREIATMGQDMSLQTVFHSGADGLISSTNTQGTSYCSYNPHSDLALLTDPSGTVISELHFDAWGNTSEQTDEPFNYLGKHMRRDYDLGLIKMGARYYDYSSGRFISRDPMGPIEEMPVTSNKYVYANDDPVGLTDLSGLSVVGDMTPTCEIISPSPVGPSIDPPTFSYDPFGAYYTVGSGTNVYILFTLSWDLVSCLTNDVHLRFVGIQCRNDSGQGVQATGAWIEGWAIELFGYEEMNDVPNRIIETRLKIRETTPEMPDPYKATDWGPYQPCPWEVHRSLPIDRRIWRRAFNLNVVVEVQPPEGGLTEMKTFSHRWTHL